MPTATFYNLSKEKREKILSAIKDEFTRVTFNEVSINKIIQAAGISRGSFYQYFINKGDMLTYIMSDYQHQLLARVQNNLTVSNGDVFNVFSDILDFSLEFVMEQKTNRFCKNLFADIRITAEILTKHSQNEVHTMLLNELTPYIDLDLLDLRTIDDFPNMVDVLTSLTRDAIAEIFLDLSSHERSRKTYLARLELLKNGFMKNKE